MAKKYYGRFDNNTAKMIKGSKDLFCQVTEDGTIYICNSYSALRMFPEDYEAIVRPISQRDPGNWSIRDGVYSVSDFDIKRAIDSAVSDTPRDNLLLPAPFRFTSEKHEIQPFYCKAADFVIFFDAALISGFPFVLSGSGPKKMAVAFDGDDAVGVVLPLRIEKSDYVAAVRAVFGFDAEKDQPEDPSSVRALRRENRQLRADLDELQRRFNEIREKDPSAPENAAVIAGLEKQLADEKARADALVESCAVLREKLAAAESAQPAPEAEKTDVHAEAEKVRAYWDAFDGIRAVIAGAKTSAPVVWLDGPQVLTHKDDIRKAGGLFSGKRRAYYFSLR